MADIELRWHGHDWSGEFDLRQHPHVQVGALSAANHSLNLIRSVLRRLTTWVTLIGEQQFLTRVIPKDEQLSIYLMLIGKYPPRPSDPH